MWLTPSNALSLLRLVLGLTFPWLPEHWRSAVVVAAAASDLIDGPLSRWARTSGTVGRVLDPVADKVFVAAAVVTLILESRLTIGQAILLALRDITVAARAGWIVARHGWADAGRARPTRLGKLTTFLQFLTLLAALAGSPVFLPLFIIAAAVGAAAAVDYLRRPLPGRATMTE